MAIDTQTDDRLAARRTWPDRLGIWLLLLGIVLIRLPFWPHARALRDGIAYSIGALVTHVAHPPGSIGYCLLGGWLDPLTGNVERAFIYINYVAGVLGAYFCYRLAKTARLSEAAALLAAATYGLSINTLTAALTIAPHLVEGAGAILIAWLGLLAMQTRRRPFAIGCTIAVALIGSFRPTASAFLIPMWLYSIYTAEAGPFAKRMPIVLLQIFIFAVIAGVWSYGNNYYMTRAGYGGTTYEKQVLTPAPYDYVTMSTNVNAASGHTYHLPAAEILAWLEPRLHVRLLPHIPDWPTPSLSRAIKLSVQQAIKQATFLIVSVPALIVVALLCGYERIIRRRLLAWHALDRSTWTMLVLWLLPAGLFFIFGHLGTMTYLQNYLGALAIGCAALLTPGALRNDGAQRNDGDARDGNAMPTPWLTYSPATFCAIAGAAVFTLGRPLPVTRGPLNLINVSLLQYTGPAKVVGYGASRISSVTASTNPADVAPEDQYLTANTDAELIRQAREKHFEYLNPAPPSTNHTP